MSTFVLDPQVHVAACVPREVKNVPRRQYKDKQYEGGEIEWKKRIDVSTTVYVGNLSCYTNEYQLYELFGRCGSVKRIIMGLDKIKKTPCGFCFVEFDERDGATNSINYLNRIKLDGRELQVNIDAGFKEGRQYGRGAQGGQIGDERRQQREQSGASRGGGGGGFGASQILTRSITIVACLTIISTLLITCQSAPLSSNSSSASHHHQNTNNRNFRTLHSNIYNNRQPYQISPFMVSQAQLGESRAQFEKSFAQLLVNIMKSAKPTLLKAFIQATLADKQLKEIAIALFFNNTSSATDSD